ncbi:MAG: peptidylprolyl isomerase [bacterium]|nr:peptidylprolyl isomerase [bacterium]
MRILTALLIALTLSGSLNAQKKKKHDYVFKISTEYGDMFFILFDETPKHKANFLKLTEEGFYTGTTFHRVMNNFMIQGGDPNSKKGGNASKIGTGGPGYTVEAEFVDGLYHKKGAIAAARQPDSVNPKKNSSGSQFYIAMGKKISERELSSWEKRGKTFSEQAKKDYQEIGGTPHLDGEYVVFGEIMEGIDIIDIIAAQEVNKRNNRPLKDIKMTVTVEKLKLKKITKLYGYEFE